MYLAAQYISQTNARPALQPTSQHNVATAQNGRSKTSGDSVRKYSENYGMSTRNGNSIRSSRNNAAWKMEAH